jgi:WD40 repeat protein
LVDERALLDGARETGFGGGNSEVRHGNRDDSSRCVAVAMGHVSRIWHVKFGRGLVDPGAVEMFSFGEDCSRQRWELDVDLERWAGGKGGLRQCAASTGHSGKNIWSAAVLTRGESEPLVATGGADGKIVISGKATGTGFADTYGDLNLSLTFDEVLQSLQGGTRPTSAPQPKHTKPAFRYAFLSDTVMAATASGRLFLATMGDPLVWEEIPLPEAIVTDLNTFNVIKSPVKDTAVIGSASGKVYLFRKGHGLRDLASLGEKISDIVLLEGPNHTAEERPWSVVINVLGLDHAVLLHFDPATDTSTIDPRKIRLPEHYIVTAAAFCRSALILGSRTGSLTVYTADPETEDFVPATSRKVCKTKDAITCIVAIPGNPSSFLATCRDGKYRIFTISAGSIITLQHEISPPVNTLEAAFFTTPDLSHGSPSNGPLNTANTPKSQLILHGFRGPNFLSYNDSTRSVITSVHCGGANRAFATVSCPHDPSQTRFVFSKAGTLRVVSQGAEGERVLRTGGHGREVKSLASSHLCGPTATPGSDQQQPPRDILVATAAEDTSIRIWRHHPDSPNPLHPNKQQPPQMECLSIIEGHSSGIQTLRFFTPSRSNPPSSQDTNPNPNNPTYLLSSAGSEELFIHRLSHIASASYDALAVVREAVWDDKTPDKDLRIVDFDVAGWASQGDDDDNKGEGEAEGEMLITMALSDSSVRSYVYSPPRSSPPSSSGSNGGGGGGGGGGDTPPAAPAVATGGRFKLLASGRYTGACPTQVRHLRVDAGGEKGGEVHVLTAFTDGHVAVWETKLQQQQRGGGAGEFCLALVVRLHQSSIKSLDLSSSSAGEGRWFVATGGDDNALGFLQLAWDVEKGEYAVLGRHRVRDGHAAAVTGLCIVNENPGATEVATVSNDQRVKLWRAERSDSAGLRVALLDSRYSSVADAGDLELIAPGKLMVGGVGMEVWDVLDGGLKEA